MSGFITRPAVPQDAAGIMECWHGAFGDRESLILDFLRETDVLESAVVAELNGCVRSVMFAFNDLDFEGVRTSYLYALCTHSEYRSRGMGRTVAAALTERCFAGGAEMVCLSPAGPALQTWYQRILGMKVLQYTSDIPINPEPIASAVCSLLDGKEYAYLRSSCISVTPQLIAAQSVLYRYFGGEMLRIMLDGKAVLACAEPQGEAILVRELLCAPGDEFRAVSAISRRYGNRQILLRQCSAEGRALLYLTKNRRPLQAMPAVVFPFTLE